MRLTKLTLVLLVGMALLLQACAAPDTADAIATGIAQTLQISQLETAAAGGGNGQQAQPTAAGADATAAPPTETPTITLTPTSSIPFVSVSENTNCRTGPNTSYGLVTTIQTGVQVEVLKVFNNANYVVVRNPSGSGDCWLWLQYATPANFAQYNLPVATQPPTPTPTFTPTPSFDWEGVWNTYAGGSSGTITLHVSGNTITGTFTLGLGGSISGSLSADRRTASGDYDTSSDGTVDGSFVWAIKPGNLNQWIGNYNAGAGDWCGWRAGSSMPNPCAGP